VNGLASLKDCPAGLASQIFPVRTFSCIANFSSSVYHYLALLISSSIFTLELSPEMIWCLWAIPFKRERKREFETMFSELCCLVLSKG